MKKRILAITISSLFIFLGCSLKYSQSYQDESNVPEFIFTDAVYTKYEDDAKKLSLSAGVLEQYKEGNSMYARDVSFQLLKKTGEIETEGSCKLLSANSDEEKYTLYDDIKIKNFDENLEVTAGSIRWNGKSEQLTSSRNDMVTIKKGDTTMQGSGFSASAISKKFAFTGVITGEFEKNEDSGNNSKEEVSVSVESEK
ncbi:MAG: LPS export ABC transporter periplasmic protein LptC [Spirochaetia bacterium]|nr:LPS export ABC transporter periplasmic protein LptC [Treponema sp.]MBR0544619.1 LPS export ABC transporter periplasmic protein LptC [Treponema sp.]MCI6366439.1 LPS export ABC transporter periplasmic protein LptC [Spirochaetia bacterium]MCI7437392.1 LPS export ABC transporter periplasmic protein LptC [Spirochaetia bacterium]